MIYRPLEAGEIDRALFSAFIRRQAVGLCRRRGVGRWLFNAAADWAKAQGAEKLYISAHSAVESQAFYSAMGCVDAAEYQQSHVDEEPFDCQLEFKL